MRDRSTGGFFRWIPTVIALCLAAGLFAVWAVVDGSIASVAVHQPERVARIGDPSKIARMNLRGAVSNAAITALCLFGWFFMRKRTRSGLVIGTGCVIIAFGITSIRWLWWAIVARYGDWIEPVLIWPLLLYPILYGLRAARKASASQ